MLCLRIIEERDFARAYRALKEAKNPSDVPNTPMVALIKQIRIGIWAEKMKALSDYEVKAP